MISSSLRVDPNNRFPSDVLFVVGLGRSGTTFIEEILGDWFDYGMGPEATFIKNFRTKVRRFGDLAIDRNLRRLLGNIAQCKMLEIARSNYPPPTRFDVVPEMIWRHIPERSPAGVLYGLFGAVAEARGRSRLGNKDPRFWRILPMLLSLFPLESKFICIVRDGRDVALSVRKMPWGQKSVYACAQNWSRYIKVVTSAARTLPTGQLMLVRYEDCLQTPARTVKRLEKFLGVCLGSRTQLLIQEMEDNPYRNNCDKWKEAFSQREIRIYEAVAGRELRQMGYLTQRSRPKAYLHEQLYYNLEEASRLARVNLSAVLRHSA